MTGGDYRRSEALACLDLRGAILKGAMLQEADLTGTHLEDADLRDADLTGAMGLQIQRLGGSDLGGARLPKTLPKWDEQLKTVEAMSQNAGKLFVSNLALCVLAYFIVGQTQDVQLFATTSSATTKLPFLDAQISVRYFYLILPFALVCLYSYFHLQVLRLWQALRSLPAFFPDGMRQDLKTYPWQLNNLVRGHLWRLRVSSRGIGRNASASAQRPRKKNALFALESVLSVLRAWVMPLVTLVFPWFRYLVRKERIVTFGYCVAIAVLFWLMASFYHLTKVLLRRDDVQYEKWFAPLTDKFAWARLLTALFVGWALWHASIAAMDSLFPHLAGSDLSNSDLRYLDLTWADLRGANLSRARMDGTNLTDASLTKADLRGVDLTSTTFDDTKGMLVLEGADLRGSQIPTTFDTRAFLQGAIYSHDTQVMTSVPQPSDSSKGRYWVHNIEIEKSFFRRHPEMILRP